MKQQANAKGFTLIEVMAAMLLLSLAYAAILESFSGSLSQISKLDRHYTRLLESEETTLAMPLFFANTHEDDTTGTVFLEGSTYKLILIQPEASPVATLVLRSNP